eukprot:TRINITY_DN2186_c0_g3_i3.p1 TRINITY_DN2186_c0_g3~~TRINITY_DN2186_c0_g3_i3.p1  ORF type:complete len:113 (-),score=21.13 TRINITY_DN2186_c0_g3_i3:240-578(-)
MLYPKCKQKDETESERLKEFLGKERSAAEVTSRRVEDCKFPDVELVLMPSPSVAKVQRLPQLEEPTVCVPIQITVNYLKKFILRKIASEVKELPIDKPEFVLSRSTVDTITV